MDRQEGLELLRDAISYVLSKEPETITEESRFREDLEVDSLDFIDIAGVIEDRVDIRLPDGEMKKVRTIGDALDLMMDENNRVSASEV